MKNENLIVSYVIWPILVSILYISSSLKPHLYEPFFQTLVVLNQMLDFNLVDLKQFEKKDEQMLSSLTL